MSNNPNAGGIIVFTLLRELSAPQRAAVPVQHPIQSKRLQFAGAHNPQWGVWQAGEDAFERTTHAAGEKNGEGGPEMANHNTPTASGSGDRYHSAAAQEIVSGHRNNGVKQLEDDVAAQLAQLAQEPEKQWHTLVHSAWELHALGENAAAHRAYLQALNLFPQTGLPPQDHVQLLVKAANNAKDGGQWDIASAFFTQALVDPALLQDPLKESGIRGEFGETLYHQKNILEAEQQFKRSLDLAIHHINPGSWASQEALGDALSRLYTLYLNTQQAEAAEQLKISYAFCPVPITPMGF